MKYDFNAPVDRSNNLSVKYDNVQSVFGTEDVLPLWIADMDMPVAEPIVKAMAERNDQAIFGYTERPASYDQAIIDWQKRRNNWEFTSDQMGYGFGVVPALASMVLLLSHEDDEVLFFSPVYPQFYHVVEDWNRKVLVSEFDETDGQYTINFEDLEEKLKRKPAFLIMCNPHNPGGRVWTKEELTRVGDLCLQYGVKVVSDEIHSDLVLWGNKHTPFATLGQKYADNTVTCISSTKTFNLAGLQACTVVFPNAELKGRYESLWKKLNLYDSNCFSPVAVEAAFTHGEEWLEQAISHFEDNMKYVKGFIDEKIPEIKVEYPESTYLMWMDCRGFGMTNDELKEFMVKKARLGLNSGEAYGSNGENFMRLNVACPRSVLEEAMNRLETAVKTIR